MTLIESNVFQSNIKIMVPLELYVMFYIWKKNFQKKAIPDKMPIYRNVNEKVLYISSVQGTAASIKFGYCLVQCWVLRQPK